MRTAFLLILLAVGCGKDGGDASGGGSSGSAPSGAVGGYTYQLHVPSSYTGAPAPLLIAMHGTGGNGDGMIGMWRDLADANGFLILAPNYYWNETYFTEEGDAAVFEMIDQVAAKYAVDRKRIYVNGVSTGGTWSFTFGLQYADSIAAGSVFAGGYTGDNDLMVQIAPRPIAYYLTHGVNDSVLPVENARSAHAALQNYGHPVQYVEHGGGHSVPAGAPETAWAFMAPYALP